MGNCIYKPLYQTSCNNETSDGQEFCDEHKFISCAQHSQFKDSDGVLFYVKCSKKAIYECNAFNGSWPCGQPLCSEHHELHSH